MLFQRRHIGYKQKWSTYPKEDAKELLSLLNTFPVFVMYYMYFFIITSMMWNTCSGDILHVWEKFDKSNVKL